MKVRPAQLPRRCLLNSAGLQWPGASAVMFHQDSAGDILGGAKPANDVEGSSRRPKESEENLHKVAREYRRLFGSAPPRARLDGGIGRLIFSRRARSIG